MIPVSLHLTDFLSYKGMAEPLDFTGLRLACLSGANGHGKSALLDAMTWALWGKARGCEGGQDQDRLIRDGADACAVELAFSFDDQTYRVRRTRSRTGKAELVLNIRAPDGGWTDLAGEGILATQQNINALLRMDYETFVASAFILQGRADTFTSLDPADKKVVLGKILGLEIYESLAERAKEHKKDAQAEADALKAELAILERDLVERPEIEARRAEAVATIEAVGGERAVLEPVLAEAEKRLADLRGLAQSAAQAVRRAAEGAARAAADATEVERLREADADLAARAEVAPGVEGLAGGAKELEERERALEEARARHDELAAEAASLTGRIEQERVRLETEAKGRADREGEIAGALAAEPEAREVLAAARARIQALDGLAGRRDALLAEHQEVTNRLAALDAEAAERERQRGEIEEKLRLIEGLDAACPLCGEPLTPSHRQEIRRSLRAGVKALHAAGRKAETERKKLETRRAAVVREGKDLATQLDERGRIAAQVAQLEATIGGFDGMRTERARVRDERGRLASALANEEFAPAEREKLAGVRAEMAATGHDPAALAAVKKRLAEARRAVAAIQDARVARERLTEVRARITSALERAAAAEREAAGALEELGGMREQLVGLPEAERVVAGLTADRRRLDEREGLAVGERTAAERAFEALARKEEEAAAVRARRLDATRRAALYAKLTKVFGRDGIPARIIANAIPELRHEANELLRLLSDGQLTVSIDPFRETKSRTVKETLDVTVYDARGGKRPYEMYSGGERLRIDFALRVALSRLLARRAGARLETLVIDEGFGSQDADGRARLVEAIIRVRELFRMILVITHLEELKEQFPARIEVTKDDVEGSRARVV